jgi:hypothetical protein
MAQDRKRGGLASQKATLSQLVQGLIKQANSSEADDQWQSILIKAILQVVGDVNYIYIYSAGIMRVLSDVTQSITVRA